MNKNKLFFIIPIVLLFWGGVTVFKDVAAEEVPIELGIPIKVANVEIGNLIEGINYVGTLNPKNSVVLSSKITSQVVEGNVQEGDSVKKGDIIAKLNDSQSVAALQSTVKKIETMQVSSAYLNEEVETYNTSSPMVKKIETLELNYDYLSDEDEKYRQLFEHGAIAKSEYDKVKHEKDLLKMQLEEVKASSEDAYNQLENQKNSTEAQIRELNAKVNELKISIADTEIVAPISGKVRMLYYKTGDLAMGGKPFVIIDATEGFIAKVNVSEQDLGKISGGSKTLLKITGVKDEIQANVTRIMPSVNANTRIGEVEIGIAALGGMDIAIGTSVEVKFITDEMKGGVVISKTAIKKLKDKEFVYVIKNDVAYEQAIKTGLVVGDSVQVIDGLNVAEKIAVNNLTRLYDGSKVYIAQGEDK